MNILFLCARLKRIKFILKSTDPNGCFRLQTSNKRKHTMTTAHRPTWKAAVGKSGEGGWNSGGIGGSAGLSHLDLPAHTKLKFRVSKVF